MPLGGLQHPRNSLESLSFDLTQLCSSDLCVLGVFALQLMALSGMLLEGSVTPLVVKKLLERNVGSFVNSLKESRGGCFFFLVVFFKFCFEDGMGGRCERNQGT